MNEEIKEKRPNLYLLEYSTGTKSDAASYTLEASKAIYFRERRAMLALKALIATSRARGMVWGTGRVVPLQKNLETGRMDVHETRVAPALFFGVVPEKFKR